MKHHKNSLMSGPSKWAPQWACGHVGLTPLEVQQTVHSSFGHHTSSQDATTI